MKALRIYAGRIARLHVKAYGLLPKHVRIVPAAAGGPKGLILGPIDRFLFGHWLTGSSQPIDLIGASIGAWRMATACLKDPVSNFARLEQDYIHQHYPLQAGQRRPSPGQVSDRFSQSLQSFYGDQVAQLLGHPRYRLHILASRGRHILRREQAILTALGYAGAFLSNMVNRKAMGGWLERVVFSSGSGPLPFLTGDYPTRPLALTEQNFMSALQASCSIPFVLRPVSHIPGAPLGSYWDGGITDYHLHLNYATGEDGLVLYPHFQKNVIPGWLDKQLPWRHGYSSFLDRMVLLAPNPEWVNTLPNGKLPDRTDFTRYGNDLVTRVRVWQTAVGASEQLADELAHWLERPNLSQVGVL